MGRAGAVGIALWGVTSAFGAPSTVTVWGLSYGPDSKGLETVIRAFEAEHPRYRVRLLSFGAGRMNPQKLMTAIVGRTPPDVITQDRFTIADWASRGAFRPLDDLIARDRERDPRTPTPEQYYPAAWQEACYEGRVYGIPTTADNRALYWNRALFRRKAAELRAAGLDPDRPPRTWSELLAYSAVLTEFDAEGRLRVAGFLPNFGNAWLYYYAFANEASFLSPDGRRCTLDAPEVVEALEFMLACYRIVGGYENEARFGVALGGPLRDPFVLGRVAMKIDGNWNLGPLARLNRPLDFGVAPPPSPDDRLARRGRFARVRDPHVTWTGGFAYAIPRGARNLEGAWALIKFLTSLEGRLIEARAQRDWNARQGRAYVPAMVAHREANRRLLTELAPTDPRLAAGLRMHGALMEVARVRPATFASQVLWDEHVRAVEVAATGRASPVEALRQGRLRVQSVLDEEFEKARRPRADLWTPTTIGLGLALAGIGWGIAREARRVRGRAARSEAWWGFALVSPWLAGFLGLILGPMIYSLVLAFTQYDVLNEARWVGARNFVDLVRADGGRLQVALANAAYLAGVGVPLGIATGLALALLLDQRVRGLAAYRTAFYLPAVVPVVAASVLWLWLLHPSPDRGLMSALWEGTVKVWFGLEPPDWLGAPEWAKPSLVLMGLWGAGGGMLLWLAGLRGIPSTLYEAARLDGASAWAQFRIVTWPQMSPIVLFNSVTGLMGALQEFDRVYVLTGGGSGPSDSLLMPVTLLFSNGFGYFRMGYASALAWVLFVLILVLTLLQLRLARHWVYYESAR